MNTILSVCRHMQYFDGNKFLMICKKMFVPAKQIMRLKPLIGHKGNFGEYEINTKPLSKNRLVKRSLEKSDWLTRTWFRDFYKYFFAIFFSCHAE